MTGRAIQAAPRRRRGRLLAGLVAVLSASGFAAPLAFAGGSPARPAAEDAVRQVVEDYERAIETKDLDLFRTLKPNLTADEERRLRSAFAGTTSHEVTITIVSIAVEGDGAVVVLSRRDTLEGSIISSFPQTLRLARRHDAWAIEEIGR